MKKNDKSIIIENRKARHDYFINDTLECGISLRGNEVKSIRAGKASIKEAWISTSSGDMIIKQMHITPWETANRYDVDEVRDRVLLAHRSEISKFSRLVARDGYTLVPLKIYFNDSGKCKVLVGLCKGKHEYDKRATEKERSVKKAIREKLKQY